MKEDIYTKRPERFEEVESMGYIADGNPYIQHVEETRSIVLMAATNVCLSGIEVSPVGCNNLANLAAMKIFIVDLV